MECDTKISVDEPLTTDVFAYVLYDALVYVPLSEVSYIKDGNIYYEKEKVTWSRTHDEYKIRTIWGYCV